MTDRRRANNCCRGDAPLHSPPRTARRRRRGKSNADVTLAASFVLMALIFPTGSAFQFSHPTASTLGSSSYNGPRLQRSQPSSSYAWINSPSPYSSPILLPSKSLAMQLAMQQRKPSPASRASTSLLAAAPATEKISTQEAVSVNKHSKKNNKSKRIDANDDTISALHRLRKFKTNRDVESAIVRLGRKGRTVDALQLYHAIWTLDGLKQQYRLKQHKKQKEEGETYDASDIGLQSSDGREVPPSLVRYVSASKLRPTTRLMNSAIDACSRSQPSARQSTAFETYEMATSPRNPDRSKKPGGALSPNVFTFGSLLACCARNGDVETSLELLRVLEEGTEHPDAVVNEVIYSTVISACERAAEPNVKLALRVLNRAVSRLSGDKTKNGMGVVGFNAAISTMARAAEWKMALQLLGEMILYSKSSSDPPSTLDRLNPMYTPLESIREENGGESPAPLLHVVAADGNEDDRIVVPRPDEVTFGTVLAACERSGEWEQLLHVVNAAKEYGVGLDGMALTSALHACQQLGLADEALEYLEMMKHLGDDDDYDDGNVEANKGANGGSRGGRERRGSRQRKPLRGPDGVAYRLAISACARAPGGGRWQDGIRLLHEMRSRSANANNTAAVDCAPDVVAYTAAIAGCSEAGEYAHAMSLIAEMRREGIRPNVVTFSAVINACASASANLGRRREEGDRSKVSLEEVRAPMARALRLLEAMKSPKSSVRPNIVTYNAAIRACAEGLNLEGAFDLLRQLEEEGLRPTIVTYGSLMTACERVGDVEAASKVFRMVKETQEEKEEDGDSDREGTHLKANEIIYGAAISCCRKARQPERALLLLRKMISEQLSPNTATFNTVIAALSEGGRPDSSASADGLLWEKALAVYKVMKSKHAPPGVAPNRQTYSILVRCLSANLQPAFAESVLADMREAGLVPDVDLYTATVRSYERCGSPIKALGVMESMREVGYDFYEIKVLDEAFKNGVRILNRVGRGFSSSDRQDVMGSGGDGDYVDVGVSYAMREEEIGFDEEDGLNSL